MVLQTAKIDCFEWESVCACSTHSNSAWLPHPQLLPGASARAAGQSGAAVNYGCMGPDWEYRSSSFADERCIALPRWKQGGDGVNIEMPPNPQHGQFRWPQGGIEKGMCRVYAGGRVKVGGTCKLGKCRIFSVGKGMGGVCAVGEKDSGTGVCQCLWETVSNSLSYWWRRNTKRLPSSEQLWLAHNVGLCSLVAGGDRGGGGCKDHTHSAHILLFSLRVVLTVCAHSSDTFLISLICLIYILKGPLKDMFRGPNPEPSFSENLDLKVYRSVKKIDIFQSYCFYCQIPSIS